MNVRRKHIREVTSRLLTQANILRPAVNVREIARLQNATVHIEGAEDKYAGYLFRDKARGIAVIGVNSKHSETRQRFTIAHEIGHLVLHAISTDEPVHFDEIFMRRDPKSAEGSDWKEMEANLFAAELLMPAQMIAHDVSALHATTSEEVLISRLAEQYEVSEQAMGIRLSYLNYIQV